MVRPRTTLKTVLAGTSDANIAFRDLRGLLVALGFKERIGGDHHIFTHASIAEILNLQPKKSKAKPYQVKQIRTLILKYKMGAGVK